MARTYEENFNAANQALTAYDSDWTSIGTNDTARIDNNQLRFNSGSYGADAQYENTVVSIPNNGGIIGAVVTAGSNYGVIVLRYRIDADNEYYFQFGSGLLWIRRRIAGGSLTDATARINAPVDITSGPVNMALEVDGTTIRAYWGDLSTPVLTSTSASNSLTATGHPAIEVNHGSARLDDLYVDDGQAVGGQVPQSQPVIGSITPTSTGASIPYTYPGSDITGMRYLVNPGNITGIATSSPIDVAGLSPSTAYSVVLTPTNATGDGTQTATESFTTLAAQIPAPVNAPVFGAPTNVTQSGATVPFTHSGGDATGFEWRVGTSGAFTPIANSPIVVTGQPAETLVTVQCRATNDGGSGPIATTTFTTSAAPVTGTITSLPLTDLNDTISANTTVDVVVYAIDSVGVGTPLFAQEDVTVNASGIFTITSNSFTSGVRYFVAWIEANGDSGSAQVVAS